MPNSLHFWVIYLLEQLVKKQRHGVFGDPCHIHIGYLWLLSILTIYKEEIRKYS